MSTKEIRIFIAAAVHNVIHLTLNRLCSSKYKLHKYQQGCMPCPVRYILFFKYIPEKSALCEVEVQTKSYYQIAKVNIWFIFPQSCESLLEKNVMKFKLRFSFLFPVPTFNFFGLAEQAWHYNDTWCWHYNGIWSIKTLSHASIVNWPNIFKRW